MVEVWLPYGKTEVCVRVPTGDLLDKIEPNDVAVAENPESEIENALMNPLGTGRLSESARPGNRASIVLKDAGALTNQMILSAILKELSSTGIKDEDVTVIVSHDPLITPSAQEQAPLGEAPAFRTRLLNHDSEASKHEHAGKTSRGTDVHLNKRFTEADVKVLAGVVEPHPLAGYCGGRECILPGISAVDTTRHNLSLSLNAKAKRGILEGNPVHEDMVEAAQLARVDFTLDVVRNSRFEVVRAFAGDLDQAFDGAVKLAEEMYKVPAEGRADIVFVSPGGHPFDANLFEASKSIDAALEVVKRGKVIVLAAECPDGYGNRDFHEAMSGYENPKDLEKSLKTHFTVGGFMAYRLITCLQRAKVVLVSTMPDYYVSKTLRMTPARTANDAFRYASDVVGKNGRVSFIPRGNWTIPVLKPAEQ